MAKSFGDWLLSTRAVLQARLDEARADIALLEPMLKSMPEDKMPAPSPAKPRSGSRPVRRPAPSIEEVLDAIGPTKTTVRALADKMDRQPSVLYPAVNKLIAMKRLRRGADGLLEKSGRT